MNAFNRTISSRIAHPEAALSEAREVQQALELLRLADVYAQDAGKDKWQFAVEICRLRDLGMTDSALRWLLCKGTVAHREEITQRDDQQRVFRSLGTCMLTDNTCFILGTVPQELAPVHCVCSSTTYDREVVFSAESHFEAVTPTSILPVWDSMRHELRLGDVIVKRFKHRSRNQEAVLTAFEEEGWPHKVDDPLAPFDECDPKRRLNDTIKGLNHHQLSFLIRFRGDGTGEAVVWELAESVGSNVFRAREM